MSSNRVTSFIVVGLLLGIGVGLVIHDFFAAWSSRFADVAMLFPTAFLRLIRMIIAPLVLSTLIIGIAKMGDIGTVGRVGAKALCWFLLASLSSLTLGLILVGILRPGNAAHFDLPSDGSRSNSPAADMSLQGFIAHAIPTSVVDAMARNEVLQIVVFAVFFGVAMTSLPGHSQRLFGVLDDVSHIMLKVTGGVMLFAPLAVFGAIAAIVAKDGLEVIRAYSLFVGEFYIGIILLWAFLIGAGVFACGLPILRLVRDMRGPVVLAFSTASSEAAYPKTLAELERFGISNRVASFVLSVGYSFNLDGSMMYCTFAIMFIAQVYGIHISASQQVLMVLILLLTSKGIAGMPRASLVVIAVTLPFFDIPEAGLALLLGIDHFLDMGRSATNVIGNTIAAAIVAKWEGEAVGKDLDMKPHELLSD